jgi:CDP-diacylglycerol pyrophosphatase
MTYWNIEVRSSVSKVLLAALVALAAQPAYADRNLLWNIVNLKCLRHLAKAEAPIPCDSIDVSNGWDRGVALLKDVNGRARMLAVPTHRVTGIEDPELLTLESPNYFASAWAARPNLEFRLKRPLPREALAIAVDSMASRTQDQLSLEIDCLDKEVGATLASYSDTLDQQWREMTVELKGRRYWARRLDSDDLSDVSPFNLLAEGIDGAKKEMGVWSLAAVGSSFSGKPGFILLADRAEPAGGGHAEDLQDNSCAAVGSKS